MTQPHDSTAAQDSPALPEGVPAAPGVRPAFYEARDSEGFDRGGSLATIDERPAGAVSRGLALWAATVHTAVIGVVLAVVWWAVSATVRDGVQAGMFNVAGRGGGLGGGAARVGSLHTPPTLGSGRFRGGGGSADMEGVPRDAAFEALASSGRSGASAVSDGGVAAVPAHLRRSGPELYGTPGRVIAAPGGEGGSRSLVEMFESGSGTGGVSAGGLAPAASGAAVSHSGVASAPGTGGVQQGERGSAVQWEDAGAREADAVLTTAPVAMTPPRHYMQRSVRSRSGDVGAGAGGLAPAAAVVDSSAVGAVGVAARVAPVDAAKEGAAVSVVVPVAGDTPRNIFAAPASRVTRFTGSFYGMPAGSRNVYLIDASGSLIDTLPFAVEELRHALATLTPQQWYAVVFFQGDTVVEAAPAGLLPATPANVAQTLAWLDPENTPLRAAGRTDATVALAHAMSYEPDVLFLLSDGVTGRRDPAGDRHRLLSLVKRFAGDTVFHTVQFIDPDPLARAGQLGTLEQLANLTHGEYRYINAEQARAAAGR